MKPCRFQPDIIFVLLQIFIYVHVCGVTHVFSCLLANHNIPPLAYKSSMLLVGLHKYCFWDACVKMRISNYTYLIGIGVSKNTNKTFIVGKLE